MKQLIKQIGTAAVLMAGLTGCGLTDLEDLRDNPVAVSPDNAETALIMNAAQIELAQIADEVNDETSPYVRMLPMTGATVYQANDLPTSFSFLWSNIYEDFYPELNLVISNSDENGFTLVGGAAKVMKAYATYTLVDLFGDVPFVEAGAGTELISPVADPGADVYAQADMLLEQAITDLSNPVGNFDNDLYYGGDASKWLALANTLKLRRAVMTKLVNGSAASTINAVVSGGSLIDENSEDWEWQYGTSITNPDARHPEYAANYSVAAALYQSNYYMWLFFGEKDIVDPRIRYYFYRQDCDETDENAFTLPCAREPFPAHWRDGLPFCTASLDSGDPNQLFSGYWGRDHGNADGIPPDGNKRTVPGVYPVGGKYDNDDCSSVQNNGVDGDRGAGIQPIFQASYTHFLLAEAALTIDGVDGDAKDFLEQGIRLSMSKVIGFGGSPGIGSDDGVAQETVDNYVEEVLDGYDDADDDGKLNIIIKEFMLAANGAGQEIYNAYRRTGKPEALQPTEEAGPGAFPRSFWYPANHVNLNQNANQKGDLEVKVFWDTNPDGFIE